VTRNGFAPKVVLSLALSPQALVYVQAAEGYRAGGINTTGDPDQVFSAADGPQPDRFYQGDEMWSYEAGGRFVFLEGRLAVRAAAFAARWTNIQSDELLPSGLPFTANIGDGANNGLEAEGTFRSGALTLRASGLVNAPELDRANPDFPARAEIGLAGVPSYSLQTSASYKWDLGSGVTAALDGRLAYVGPSHLTFDAAISPHMGAYSTARLAASLAERRWTLTAALENPADTRGDTFAYGNPFTLRTTQQVTPLRPRTVSVTLERRF
jgi:outer membrane receptor protein involved in Fe transport